VYNGFCITCFLYITGKTIPTLAQVGFKAHNSSFIRGVYLIRTKRPKVKREGIWCLYISNIMCISKSL